MLRLLEAAKLEAAKSPCVLESSKPPREVIESPRQDDGHGKLTGKLSTEGTFRTEAEAPIGS